MQFYTQNGHQGEKYEDTKGLTTVQIAKLIRQEIKKKYPTMKIYVRSHLYSGGSSIYVRIKDCGFNPLNPEWNPREVSNIKIHRYNEKARKLQEELQKIGEKYNYSDCDGMIDYFNVRFWLSVEFDWEMERVWLNENK